MDVTPDEPAAALTGHARWVRVSHWVLAASLLTLATSGTFRN
jgi:cytochrome b subunit of formate dehydrogenase